MNSSKYTLVIGAINTVTSDVAFRDRWFSIHSLEKAIKCRYQFDDSLTITTSILSRSLGKIESEIDMLGFPHESGYYRGKVGHETFMLVQDGDKPPPAFPKIRGDTGVWNKIRRKDSTDTDNYILRVTMVRNRVRAKKKNKRDDTIDVRLKCDKMEFLAAAAAQAYEEMHMSLFSYWGSTEAKNLFNPNDGETVLECIARRDILLWKGDCG